MKSAFLTRTPLTGRLPKVAVATSALLALAFPAQADPRPNIIFIMGDDMDRYMFNHLLEHADVDAVEQSLGPVLSPNLDRLCAEGVVFPNHHVVSPACTPTRYAVLTGRFGSRATNFGPVWPNYDGMTYPFFNMEIQPANLTLARMLQQAGYRTGFTGKDHVHEVDGFSQPAAGADPANPTVKAQLAANAALVEAAIRSCGFDYAENVYHTNPADYPDALAVHNMDWIAKGGIDFIDEWAASHSDQPFFLYFSTTLTHAPNQDANAWLADRTKTPEGYVSFDSPLKAADGVTWTRDTIQARMQAAVNAGEMDVVGGRLSHLLWMDDAIGALLRKLEQYGVDDNTLIFLFNDHGVEYGGKGGLYEHGSKSISVVWAKNGFPMLGHSSGALLSNVDFAPTILDYAGVVPPVGFLDGKSFRPILEGDVAQIRNSVFLEFGCGRGVIMDGFKYISVRWPNPVYNSLFNNPAGNRLGWASLKVVGDSEMEGKVRDNIPAYYDADQLFDLTHRVYQPHAKDAIMVWEDEQLNLAVNPAYADRLQVMRAELQKYLDTMPGPYAEFKSAQEEHFPGSVIELY